MYDVDMGILNYISKVYEIHWFFMNNEQSPRVKKEDVVNYAQQNGIKLYWKNNCIKQLSPRKILYYIEIAKVINAINPDIIIKEEQDFYWALVNKFFMKHKIVYMIHDVLVHSGTHNGRVRQLFTDLTIKMNRHFITFSDSQKQVLLNRYGNKDFGHATSLRPVFGERIKLLFFGRIEYNKGLDILIKGLEHLFDKGITNIELSICGKGSYWDECLELIKHPNLYDLQIRFIDNAEIPNLFTSHHFLVLPYRDTTQSGPLMIAANYGLPLFAARHDSFREIYSDSCSIMYDKIELGLEQISTLTKEDYDKMHTSCLELKNKFSGENISSEIISYINQIS